MSKKINDEITYFEVNKEGKQIKKTFKVEKDIFERVKTYKDVCKELKIKELTLKDFAFLPIDQRVKMLAQHQIHNITKLFNGEWIADWSNSNQYKYYPVFRASPGGLVFLYSHVFCSGFAGAVGFYKDSKTSGFCGRTFIDIYKKLL